MYCIFCIYTGVNVQMFWCFIVSTVLFCFVKTKLSNKKYIYLGKVRRPQFMYYYNNKKIIRHCQGVLVLIMIIYISKYS